jgi:hypothetical protein
MKTKKEIRDYWNGEARKLLVGFTITDVQYMDDEDWYANPVALILKKPRMGKTPEEIVVIPQSDDEGNNGGALFIDNKTTKKNNILPVIWR